MNTLIRSALAADAGVLIDLSRRTIDACFRPFPGDEVVDRFLGDGGPDRYVEDNNDHCRVAVRDGRVVGYAVCRDDLIDLMMVDRAFHRQGPGTALLRRVEETVGRRFERLRLESFEANRSADAFYRRNGWAEVRVCFDEDSAANKLVFHRWTGRTGSLA